MKNDIVNRLKTLTAVLDNRPFTCSVYVHGENVEILGVEMVDGVKCASTSAKSDWSSGDVTYG